jgi:hypothetical protein
MKIYENFETSYGYCRTAQVEKKIARSDSKCASLQQDLEAEIFETAEATKDTLSIQDAGLVRI